MTYLIWYAAIVCTLVFIRERGQASSLTKFLVAERKVDGVIGAMSVAASWIWAPAIFVSSRAGYEWGYSGLIWFMVPNMLALAIFAPVADQLRKNLPDGYSYIQALRESRGYFRETQLAVQLLMQVIIYTIQLTAGANLLSALTGAAYSNLVIGMGLVPFAYTFFSGLRTSIFTDAIQYSIIFASALTILLAFPAASLPVDPRPFHPLNPRMLIDFGISSALGLLVAIFADHQQWQRAFAIKSGSVTKTYYVAALLHGAVTFMLGTLGSLIYREGFSTSGTPELIASSYIQLHYPPFYSALFVALTLSALISTLDSGLCAFSSLYMTEASSQALKIKHGRKLMLTLAIFGVCLSQLHLPLVTLWFIAGTIRLSTAFPTILSIISKTYPSHIGTVSILSGIIIGGGVFGYGTYLGDARIRTLGMSLSIAISGTISMIWMLRLKKESLDHSRLPTLPD